MPLPAGTRLGSYEIGVPLGAGGMGEVYRATDTKLNREVAIKVLPDVFAQDPDRMARFAREAQVLASLNHPNIASIYGVEERALVMELVEGETLAGRLAIEDALPIARQIAEALEYAHEKGIVHRDLKPANIKVTPQGRVKVLDFGLAKAMGSDTPHGDPAASPTMTMRETQAGTIIGTAAYMAPEQARGKPVDRRADIWAFGVVFYEMLSGRQLFLGETMSDTLASVLKTDPDWSVLPAETPAGVRRLLRRCLQKDPAKRLPHIGAARLELEEADPEPPPAQTRPRRSWLWPAAAAACLLATAALAFVHFREVQPALPLVRFNLPLPERTDFSNYISVSPDGKLIAFTASGADGRSSIWIHELDRLDSRQLLSTENPSHPFWSPDSRSIAFWADEKLKRVDAAGGLVQIICETPMALNGAWNDDGVILFGSTRGGLFRVPASGGAPAAATRTDPQSVQNHSHPIFLPGGRNILYHMETPRRSDSALYVTAFRPTGELETGKRVTLSRTGARYLPGPKRSGHLLFIRGATLMAQPFDETRLEASGEAYPVAEGVGSFLARPFFGASATGVLAYWSGDAGVTSLVWFDRKGARLSEPIGGEFAELSLAPDGERAAMGQRRPGSAIPEVGVVDLKRGGSSRISSDPVGAGSAVWSPDGKQLAFAVLTGNEIHVKLASGAGNEETLPLPPGFKQATDWSRDGKHILYETGASLPYRDLWIFPTGGGRKAFAYLNTVAHESQGRFSPDGKFIAYVSNETGRSEVYVQQFPIGSGKWTVSTAGGSQPRWRGDGKELYFVDGDRNLLVAGVTASPDFRVSAPQRLFNPGMFMGTRPELPRYDVTRDGQRFLVNSSAPSAATGRMTVILNWKGK